MKKLVVFAVIFFPLISNAQLFHGNDDVIGIDEHLGDTVPLELKFINEKGESIVLRDIINMPTVLSFVYFDCPGLCSPLQQGISELIDNSDLQIGKDYQVVTISFNYMDDPKKAADKKKNFAQNISKEYIKYWYYLTGDSISISKILTSTGYKARIVGLDFAHPSAIIILSPQGKITRYLYGLNFLPFDFKMAIMEAQKGLSRPSINRVYEFCFAYDPEGKRYTLEITKISASIIIFFAVILFTVLVIRSKKKAKANKES